MKRIVFHASQVIASITLVGGLLSLSLFPPTADAAPAKKIPVIYDSDIGDDIDDTWALGLLLKCPELDLKLVVGDQGKVQYRAKLFAKMLEAAGRTDVPVGIGLEIGSGGDGPQAAWIKDYDLQKYPGKVHPDGVQAIIDTVMQSKEPITIIAVGPVPNLAAALEREPRIAQKARFVGMHGSVRLGYGGSKKVSAEYNVRADARACQKVFTAPWDMIITPLDTCGLVHLQGDQYRRVRDSQDPVAAAVIQNYRHWDAARTKPGQPAASDARSSTLFDTVAVYLAFTTELAKVETLGIRVTDAGMTVIDPNAKQMAVATEWNNLNAFREFLVGRLITAVQGQP